MQALPVALVVVAFSSSSVFAQGNVRPTAFTEPRRSLPDIPWSHLDSGGLGDWDGDGDLDQLMAKRPHVFLSEELIFLENDGHAQFEQTDTVWIRRTDPTSPWGFWFGTPVVSQIARADVDGDGDDDALLVSWDGLLVLPNAGTDGGPWKWVAVPLDPPIPAVHVVPAFIDSNRSVDLFVQIQAPQGLGLHVALGVGGGRFAPLSRALTTDPVDVGVEAADLDGDGHVDFACVQSGSMGWSLQIGFGDGTGAFTLAPRIPFGASSLASCDIEGDGDRDLVLPGAVRILLNEGGRTFVEAPGRTPAIESALAVPLDVDGDLDADLALDRNLLINDGAGFFTDASGSYPVGELPVRSLQAGDLDADADLDLVLRGSNVVLLGDGTGKFLDSSPSGRVSGAPEEFADLDGDGDMDALVVSKTYPSLGWSLLVNDGRGVLEREDAVFSGGGSNGKVLFGDLDGDGDADALIRATNQLLANDGSGSFTGLPSACEPAWTGWLLDAAFGDLDADGDLDVFHGRGSAPPPSYDGEGTPGAWHPGLWRNDGTACFADDSAPLAAIWDAGLGVAIGDLDLDGDPDVVTSSGTLLINQGGASFLPAGSALSYAGYDLALGDLDGDGALDVCSGAEIAWNDGSGAFAVRTPLANWARRVALGDLNGDSRMDVLVGQRYRQLRELPLDTVEAFVNAGARTFQDGSFPRTDRREFALGDLDGDGDLDFFDGRRTFSNLQVSLAARGVPRLAHPFALELRGRPRSPYFLFSARALGPALATPLGIWHLAPASTALFVRGALDRDGKGTVRSRVPDVPSLVGRTLYWQALVSTPPVLTAFERTTVSGF